MKIGVLALQGGVLEHLQHLERLGVEAVEVRKNEDLKNIDGLILPGGESTTIGHLLKVTNIMDNLKNMILNGFPVWGTCAGMILLAREIENDDRTHLSVMNVKVKRNAYGSQLNSFMTSEHVPAVSSSKLPMVFIRAPYITSVGEKTEVLLKIEDHIVAAKEGNMLATSFHPELTDNLEFHKYFVKICQDKKYSF
jgi:pyridoxal 5'-phosphate synthase pdxT subunit